MSMDWTARELVEALERKPKPEPYDTQATVMRVDGDTLWCHFPGGVDETPVQRTIDAREGDTIQVRISGGSATATGNATAPPTDDTQANVAKGTADAAQGTAKEALETVKLQQALIEFLQAAVAEIETAKIGWAEIDDLFAEDITVTGQFFFNNDNWTLLASADGIQMSGTYYYPTSDNMPLTSKLTLGRTATLSGDAAEVRSDYNVHLQAGEVVSAIGQQSVYIYSPGQITLSAGNRIAAFGNLIPVAYENGSEVGGVYNLGSSGNAWKDLYIGRVIATGNVRPASAAASNCGSPNYPWASVYANAVDIGGNPAVAKQTTTITGTTTSAGNIALGLNGDYGVLSVRRTDASSVCVPYWNATTNRWNARITAATSAGSVVGSTSVTLEVDYYEK